MLLSTEFTGLHKIAQDNVTAANLTIYIAKYEKKYLVDLLGYDLYLLFVADLNGSGVPVTTKYLTIYNALKNPVASSDNWIPMNSMRSNRSLYDEVKPIQQPPYSEGIRTMLKGFIYYEFVNEYGLLVSQTGVVTNNNENSNESSGAKHLGLIESRYNEAVNSYIVIRNYILANLVTYPEYEGIEKQSTHWGGAF